MTAPRTFAQLADAALASTPATVLMNSARRRLCLALGQVGFQVADEAVTKASSAISRTNRSRWELLKLFDPLNDGPTGVFVLGMRLTLGQPGAGRSFQLVLKADIRSPVDGRVRAETTLTTKDWARLVADSFSEEVAKAMADLAVGDAIPHLSFEHHAHKLTDSLAP